MKEQIAIFTRMGRFFSFTLILFCVSLVLRAQTPKDSALSMHLVCFQMSVQTPDKDLKARYGNNLDVSVAYFYKTKKNLLFGIDPHYFFGKQVKEDVLAGLKTPDGTITNSDGNDAVVKMNERGWNITATVGYIIPKIGKLRLSANDNSGLIVMAGAGYLQHKINLYDEEKKLPQISGDYKKGYDRLTGGPVAKAFLGYVHFSNNRLVNFYGGFEMYTGFTKSLRSYNYDQNLADTSNRLDVLYGFRLAWMLPIYKRVESANLFEY